MVYQQVLRYHYRDTTFSRLQLVLTDDDTSSHGEFDAATKVVKEISSAKHILCVFHAVVIRYQDFVYDFLPETRDGKTLTEKGAIYGELTLSTL